MPMIQALGTMRYKLHGCIPGDYTGDINEKGEAHGEGSFVSENGWSWTGVFRHNKVNCCCKLEF